MDKLLNPYLYPGLAPQARKQIMYKTCFDKGELLIIAKAVCKESDIELDELTSSKRDANLADARKIFYHLSGRKLYKFTRKRLGAYTGRDQSTVTCAMQRCEDLLDIDPKFRALYKDCWETATIQLNSFGYEFRQSIPNQEQNGQRNRKLSSFAY